MMPETAGPRSVDARRLLSDLIEREQALLAGLARILQDELKVLAGEDADAIQGIGASRQRCIASLTELEAERRAACRQLGFGSGREALPNTLAWCDPDGSLQRRWQANLEQARRCRAQNERNGAVVSLRLGNVRKLLATLRGNPAPSTYGPGSRSNLALLPREIGIA